MFPKKFFRNKFLILKSILRRNVLIELCSNRIFNFFYKKKFLIIILLLVLFYCIYAEFWRNEPNATIESKFGNFYKETGSHGEKRSLELVLPSINTTLYNPSSVKFFCEEETKASNEAGSNMKTSLLALFVVVSSPEHSDRRQIIRNGLRSSISALNSEIRRDAFKVLFFIGFPLTSISKRTLINEAKLFDDVIIDDIIESYWNLTLKSQRLLKWVQRECNHVKYLIKVDDDVHINLRKLSSLLLEMEADLPEEQQNFFIGGHLYKDQIPVRDPLSFYGKSYLPESVYPLQSFPDFIGGFFYILGSSARNQIYFKSLQKSLIHLEDVFLTGIIAKSILKFNLTDLRTIQIFWNPLQEIFVSSCTLEREYFAVHFHSEAYNRLECWKIFNHPSFNCSNWPLILSRCPHVPY